MNDNKPFFKMLDEICEEKGIKQEKISFGWIRKLTKNNESHSIIRYEFDLNSAVSYEIAKDKYATYAMLKNNNIPIVINSDFGHTTPIYTFPIGGYAKIKIDENIKIEIEG